MYCVLVCVYVLCIGVCVYCVVVCMYSVYCVLSLGIPMKDLFLYSDIIICLNTFISNTT